MGKHHDKVAAALEKRISAMPQKDNGGYNKPGSMNKRKTGYGGVKANGSK